MRISLGAPNIDDAVVTFGKGDSRDNAWVTVHLGDGRPSASVNIIVTDEGLVVDVYPLSGEVKPPAGSTYVFDRELSEEEQ